MSCFERENIYVIVYVKSQKIDKIGLGWLMQC